MHAFETALLVLAAHVTLLIFLLLMIVTAIVMLLYGREIGKWFKDRLGDEEVEAHIPGVTDKKPSGFHIDIKPQYDDLAKRNRSIRLAFFLCTILIVVGGPAAALGYVGAHVHRLVMHLGILLGMEMGLFLLRFILPNYFIYNPEGTAFLTNNPFAPKKGNVPYGPNLHLAFPWERRNAEGNWPLTVQTESIEVVVQTMTAEVTAVAEYAWAISLARLNRFVTLTGGPNKVRSDETGYLGSFLSSLYADMNAEEVRKSIKKINEDLRREFMATNMPSNFEAQFGVISAFLYIRAIKLPQRVQRTRDAKDEANQLQEVVAEFYGITVEELKRKLRDGDITRKEYNEVLDRAMATSDNATMDIRVLRVEGVEPGMGALLGSLGGGGGGNSNRNRNRKE